MRLKSSPKRARHYIKVLHCRNLWHEIFQHSRACARNFVFEKKQVFLELAIFFVLRNNHILTKVITFSKKVCMISFELQMSQTLSTPFGKLLQNPTKESKN